MILLALCGQAVSAQQIPGFEFDHFEFPGGEFFGEASCRVIGDADSSDINSFPKLFMTSCPPGFRAETFISSLGVPAELPGGTQEGFLVVLDAPVTLAANTSFTVAGLGRGSFESTTSLQNAQPPGMDPGCLNTITTPTTTGSTTLFPHEFECGINALSAVSEALPGPNQGLFFLGSSFIGTWTPATGAKLVIQYAIITSTGRRKVRTRLSLAALIPSRRPRNSLSASSEFTRVHPIVLYNPKKIVVRRDDPLQFSATVDWRLASRPQADLALRAFDQDGILVASSEFTRVQREDSPGGSFFSSSRIKTADPSQLRSPSLSPAARGAGP